MKKTFLLSVLVLLLICQPVFSQSTQRYKIKEFKLANGLTVILNEDNRLPSIFGAVAVKGGSARDSEDATGVAHYFEHILFKGTDEIGTINYAKEKIYLDSIADEYENLAKTKDDEERKKVQKRINSLSLKAAEYAIPNELDKLLEDMGSKHINAGTGFESIVYFNSFPSHQIEKWLELYSHRFVNPVYRLFQSELETVFEEYNMYKDNPFGNALEEYQKAVFGNHPYGRPIIGYPDHIKNPSLKKMDEYFKTYYVANNMALILSGDFNSEEIIPIIKEKFGTWRKGETIAELECNFADFDGRELTKKKLTPIRAGTISYRIPGNGHEDELIFSLMNQIFSNSASTGLLDKLMNDNKLMAAGAFPFQLNEAGVNVFYFIPKLIGQSFKKAEELIKVEIEKVKKGEFDDDILEMIKNNNVKDFQYSLESPEDFFGTFIYLFTQNKTADYLNNYEKNIRAITKKDIVRIANKYFGDNYHVFYSKMGFPKKNKIKKPDFEPIKPKNSEAKSEYVKKMEKIKTKGFEPQFLEFGYDENKAIEGKDITISKINDLSHFYYTKNPLNNIFSLELKFGIGNYKDKYLEYLPIYFDLIGTDSLTNEEFNKELQKISADFNLSTSDNYLNIEVTGFEKDFDEILKLVNEKLRTPKADDTKLSKILQAEKMGRKAEKTDYSTISSALKDFVLYKENSDYLSRMTLKEVKEITSDNLLNSLKEALKYEVYINYIGKKSMKEVKEKINTHFALIDVKKKTESPIYKERIVHNEPVIYFLNEKNAIQTKNYFFVEGKPVNTAKEIAISKAFNEYIGGSMSSIIFQEIREFRSLAYSAGGRYRLPFYKDKNACFLGFVGTQADKTIEAVQEMKKIIKKMPQKPNRLDKIKNKYSQSINVDRPFFRNYFYPIWLLDIKGYKDDPREEYLKYFENMKFEEIIKFYETHIANSNLIITIVGDKREIDMEELNKIGKVVEVDKKDILN